MLAVLLARVLPKRFCAAMFIYDIDMASIATAKGRLSLNISSNPV